MPNVLMWCLYVKGNFSVEATHAGPKNLTLGTGKNEFGPEKTERQIKKYEHLKESVHCGVIRRSEWLKARPKHQLLHSTKLCIGRKPHSVWNLLQ